jgi:uncharacterized protein (TIGR04255 family)
LAPPLETAVCELRFPKAAAPFATETIVRLQKDLASRYPSFEEQTGVEVRVTPNGLQTDESQAYRFASPDGRWQVRLTQNYFGVETTAYEDIATFVDRWRWVADRVVARLELEWQERLGTRYVNRLPADLDASYAGMAGILREPLLATVCSHPRLTRLLGSMHEERYEQPDGVITVRHGVQGPPPDSGQGTFYLLDFDYYVEVVTPIDLDACSTTITTFNRGVFELLQQWAVTEDHFRVFRPAEST